MAIAIDYTPAYEQGGGIGRYVRELIQAVIPLPTAYAYRLFVAGYQPAKALPFASNERVNWATTPITPKTFARYWHRLRIPYPTIEAWTGPIRLFHGTDFVLPPLRRDTKALLTIHDLSYIHTPESASPRLKAYLERVVPRSLARADHILADSSASKQDIIAHYGVDPAKITVLLSGVNPSFRRVDATAARLKYGIGDAPYLFTIGTVQPRKNYERLIAAFERLAPNFPDLKLVIAGGKGWLDDPIYAALSRSAYQDRIRFIGFAEDADLPALYSGAALVPFISLYEGFGFPVIESMACGTPVVASNVSSIPEAAGDAAILVDPRDLDAITESCRRVLEDSALRADLIKKGYAQAARFTWERAARELLSIYAEVL
ncbi:MAG: glycosyltransferase family 4 protein [Anaerolineae bacterium]|jgi:glycosyltransferase involved in cell wall biosynthesis|nr:glycosyltransferase family 4 protein [Anaerolineae bacterium]